MTFERYTHQNMIRKPIIGLLFMLMAFIGRTQGRYWVEKGKLPDHEARYCSEWLGVCSYMLTHEEVMALGLSSEDRVLAFEPKSKPVKPGTELSFALEQIEGQILLDKGATGQGVKIGVIDGGFLKADEDASLNHLFENQLIANYKDYITPDLEAYGGSGHLDDRHGTGVMKMLGGIDPASKIQFGLATGATYYLARTDHGAFEKRLEEDLLIQALEEMEKQGVRLVNISLGYARGYQNAAENYSPEDMDGSSMIARAVDHAFFEKDMLVVVAAGNEGNDKRWRVLSTPGDAAGALTVGATKLKLWDRMEYSSIGPTFLDYVKPDISCYSSSGTSYATPVITGLAACIMELYPDLDVRAIKAAIIQAGNFYPYGNNHVGFGVPQASRLLQILEGVTVDSPKLVSSQKNTIELPGNFKGQLMAVYHKQDSVTVVEREVSRIRQPKLKIWREEKADFTTVLIGKRVIEIDWID